MTTDRFCAGPLLSGPGVERVPGPGLGTVWEDGARGSPAIGEHSGGGLDAEDRRALARELGRLGAYLLLPDISDIFLGVSGLWVDRGTGIHRVPDWWASPEAVREIAVRLIALGGRHVDEAHPCVDVRLAGGVRAHAALPPIAVAGTEVSIRIPSAVPLDIMGLREAGFFAGPQQFDAVRELVRTRRNLLITGATGAGKTTLLTALLADADPAERVIAVEDVAELRPKHPQFVALQARQPNLEGEGGIDVAALLREALRMRPDRLILGECRGAEIRELLSALNTGHDGGAGTMHANSLGDVPARLSALGALAGLSERALALQVRAAIGAILHVAREGGTRRLVAIGRFAGRGDGLTAEPVWASPGFAGAR